MKRYHIPILLLLTAAFALTVTGCTTFDNFRQGFFGEGSDAADTINIGIYEPMAGADKDGAKLEIEGIQLANKLYPQVNGKEVRLIYGDNNSDIDAAETAINTLLTKNPSVILGSYGSVYSLIAGPHIQEAKVPAITMTNTNPLITRNNDYYFRVCYIDATQGMLLSRYLEHLNVKQAGLLLPKEDEASTALVSSFKSAFRAATEDDDCLPFYEKFTTGETDFSKYLSNLKKSGVKYVVLSGETTDTLNIINQAAEMKLDVTFLGDMSWGEEDFHRGLNAHVNPDHLAFIQFFVADSKIKSESVSEAREEFLDAWHRTNDSSKEPEEAVALGYDAYRIALDAIEKSTKAGETPDGEAIRNVLIDEDYQFEGASGVIRFNRNGDPEKTAYICTWQGKAINSLYTIGTDLQ